MCLAISIKDRIITYDALVSSKLLYGLESLMLDEALLDRIDAFQRRGWRQILNWKTTYIIRENTNERLIKRISELSGKEQLYHSQTIMNRRAKLLGETIRGGKDHPTYKVLFNNKGLPNLPEKKRAGAESGDDIQTTGNSQIKPETKEKLRPMLMEKSCRFLYNFLS